LYLARLNDFLFEFLIIIICLVSITEVFITPKIIQSITITLKNNKYINRENLINQKLS
jgi:hypothetical protein